MPVKYKIMTTDTIDGELVEYTFVFCDLHQAIDEFKKNSIEVYENTKARYACVKREPSSSVYDCHWYEYRDGKYVDIPNPKVNNEPPMTLDRIKSKYKYRDTVWKQDVIKMAEYYEGIIKELEG